MLGQVRDFLNEFEAVKKKVAVMNSLKESGKIPPQVYDYYRKSVEDILDGLDERRKTLQEKLMQRQSVLQEQVYLFERCIADLEIRYAVGEVANDTHGVQAEALETGLEGSKAELNGIQLQLQMLTSADVPAETTANPAWTQPHPEKTVFEPASTPSDVKEPPLQLPIARNEPEAGTVPREILVETATSMNKQPAQTPIEQPATAEDVRKPWDEIYYPWTKGSVKTLINDERDET